MKQDLIDELNEKPIRILSCEPWNATGITIEQGSRYKITAEGKWIDWRITTDADGFERWYLKPFEPFRRNSKEKWFALMGSINQQKSFLIGKEKEFTASSTGQLFCFANDVPWAYNNNEGFVFITVKKIS